MILVNGTAGIGVGYSTEIACYNPIELAEEIERLLDLESEKTAEKPSKEPLDQKQTTQMDEEDLNHTSASEDKEKPQIISKRKELIPWYRGFTGTIERHNNAQCARGYNITGVYDVVDDFTIRISELPIGVWTRDYKEFLQKSMRQEDAKRNQQESDIITLKEYHTRHTVSFEVTFSESKMKDIDKDTEKKLKLRKTQSDSNMVLYNHKGILTKYDSAEDILQEFYQVRLGYYAKRRAYMIRTLKKEFELLETKARFVNSVIDDSIKIYKVKKNDIIVQLKELGFKKKSEIMKDADKGSDDAEDPNGYNYLLGMSL